MKDMITSHAYFTSDKYRGYYRTLEGGIVFIYGIFNNPATYKEHLYGMFLFNGKYQPLFWDLEGIYFGNRNFNLVAGPFEHEWQAG